MYRFKLKEIEIGDTEIRGGKKSTVSAIDDATGRIEWDIVDAADFSSVYKALLKAKDFLSTLEKEGKAKDDVVIDGFAEDIAKLFNAFRTHVRKAYPKEYERVSRLKESVNESKGAKNYFDDLIFNYQKAFRYLESDEKKEYQRLAKNYFSKLKEDLEVEEGEGIGYLTPNAFGKNKKNVYTSQYGYKLVPKKIKGSGLEVKQLFEYNDFQEGRIRNFDAIEDKINSILPMISNAKNKTAEFYNENPGSYNVNYPTDAILKELDDIIDQLKQANEDLSKSV